LLSSAATPWVPIKKSSTNPKVLNMVRIVFIGRSTYQAYLKYGQDLVSWLRGHDL
jgi:hypothetical protein